MAPSDVIAIIAIIVSILSLGVQLNIERQRNRKERIRDLYNQAYKDLLLEEVPAAVLAIRNTKAGIKGTGDLVAYALSCVETLASLNSMMRFSTRKWLQKSWT